MIVRFSKQKSTITTPMQDIVCIISDWYTFRIWA